MLRTGRSHKLLAAPKVATLVVSGNDNGTRTLISVPSLGVDGVSHDVSLCLFRVLQEGVTNAIKYSGVQRFEVRLRKVSDQLQLTIRDRGRGFDVDAALNGEGLGLISMRERASLVKGMVSITSTPIDGTEINVHVPLLLSEQTSAASFGAA